MLLHKPTRLGCRRLAFGILGSVALVVCLVAASMLLPAFQKARQKGPEQTNSAKKVFEGRAGRIVNIVTLNKSAQLQMQGSGVVLGPSPNTKTLLPSVQAHWWLEQGTDIVTNCHVLKDAEFIVVAPNDQHAYAGHIVYFDRDRDVAILRVRGNLSESEIPFAPDPSVGDRVFAIGNPQSLDRTLSEGIISRKLENSELLQTTAPISEGSSGGGLFDTAGRLIGITTATLKGGQNLNFVLRLDQSAAKTFWEARNGCCAPLPKNVWLGDKVVGFYKWDGEPSTTKWQDTYRKSTGFAGYMALKESVKAINDEYGSINEAYKNDPQRFERFLQARAERLLPVLTALVERFPEDLEACVEWLSCHTYAKNAPPKGQKVQEWVSRWPDSAPLFEQVAPELVKNGNTRGAHLLAQRVSESLSRPIEEDLHFSDPESQSHYKELLQTAAAQTSWITSVFNLSLRLLTEQSGEDFSVYHVPMPGK